MARFCENCAITVTSDSHNRKHLRNNFRKRINCVDRQKRTRDTVNVEMYHSCEENSLSVDTIDRGAVVSETLGTLRFVCWRYLTSIRVLPLECPWCRNHPPSICVSLFCSKRTLINRVHMRVRLSKYISFWHHR